MMTLSFKRTLRPTFLGTFACAVLAVGCAGKTKDSLPDGDGEDRSASEVAAALEADNGGMDARDVPVEFADPQIAALASFQAVQIDPTDMTTEVAAQPGARRYHIALLWGHLPEPSDATADDTDPVAVDWTGNVSVASGAIGVKRTLMFDGRDHVDPRTSASAVSFQSRTLPFVDGLFLHVVVPEGGSTQLHVQTNALTTDIDLSTLGANATGVDRLGDGRNGLAWIGYEDVPGCARGLLFGRWVKVRAELGRFRGRVIDGNGDRIGDVRGVWGHAPRRDLDLFFGKYVSVDGTHRGLFGGRYGAGAFKGLWGTRDPSNVGMLEGRYADGYDKDDGRGVFLGRWTEKCQ